MTPTTIFRSIPEQIATSLRQDILLGTLAPNQPLREQEVAARFGVSRGPIREAFRQLTEQGLLVLEPNKGVRVAQLPSPNVRPLMAALRRKIELYVLDTTFDEITPADLANWEVILQAIKRACEQEDEAALVENDLRFHKAIIESHDHDGLTAVWQPIMLRMLMQYHRLGPLMASYDEHKRILDAIRSGGKQAALDALAANIQ